MRPPDSFDGILDAEEVLTTRAHHFFGLAEFRDPLSRNLAVAIISLTTISFVPYAQQIDFYLRLTTAALPGKRHPLVADGDDSLDMGSRFWPRSAHHQGKGRGKTHF